MPNKDLTLKNPVAPVVVVTQDLNPSAEELTNKIQIEVKASAAAAIDHFKELEEPQIDIADIEKALALDELSAEETFTQASAEMLKENLTSQKISLSPIGAAIDKPSFALNKKDFKVNEFKVNVRRPENS